MCAVMYEACITSSRYSKELGATMAAAPVLHTRQAVACAAACAHAAQRGAHGSHCMLAEVDVRDAHPARHGTQYAATATRPRWNAARQQPPRKQRALRHIVACSTSRRDQPRPHCAQRGDGEAARAHNQRRDQCNPLPTVRARGVVLQQVLSQKLDGVCRPAGGVGHSIVVPPPPARLLCANARYETSRVSHARAYGARLPFLDQLRHPLEQDGHDGLVEVRANGQRLQVDLPRSRAGARGGGGLCVHFKLCVGWGRPAWSGVARGAGAVGVTSRARGVASVGRKTAWRRLYEDARDGRHQLQ